jgi:hypothetical protein
MSDGLGFTFHASLRLFWVSSRTTYIAERIHHGDSDTVSM